MTHVVIIGAGVGGVPMAYEMRALLGKKDKVTVISNTDTFHFTPSNPWVGVNWRTRKSIEVSMEKYFKRKKIDFNSAGVKKVNPQKNSVTLYDDKEITYDYLVIATGPKLAFDEIEGLGPKGFTQSVCHVEHAVKTGEFWNEFVKDPGPIVVGAVQGASCFGPAYEHALIMDSDLRKRGIRHKVPMTFVTSEPYIGHLGLGGVGDSKGMLESILRSKDIKWVKNAKVDKVEKGMMFVTEVKDDGTEKAKHELPFNYSMMLPAFKGVDAVMGIEGLVNPRGFITINEHQQNDTYKNIFSVGVCVAIAPQEATPVPTGVPKTGYMIESMVTATAHNIKDMIDGKKPSHRATWNAICLADMGDTGAVFVAVPQIPPRNVAWMRKGKWVHWAKIAFELYFLRKVKTGNITPVYEKYVLRLLGIRKRQQNK
jgi:sulfide:quinone oxidoreductase